MSITVETRKTFTFHPFGERMALSDDGVLIIADKDGKAIAMYFPPNEPHDPSAVTRAYKGPPTPVKDLAQFRADYPGEVIDVEGTPVRKAGSSGGGSAPPQLPPASGSLN